MVEPGTELMNRQVAVQEQNAQTEQTKIMSNASSLFQGSEEPNLIEFQLEMDSILENLEISLRGKILKYDDKGNRTWQDPDDKRNIIFSELGTQEILRFLSQYLNRNLILSSYKADDVPKRIMVIGETLLILLYTKYESMFYTTPISEIKIRLGYKKDEEPSVEDMVIIINMRREELQEKTKNFESALIPVIHAIESAYNRSIGGEERRSLRQRMMITQTGQMGSQQPQMIAQPQIKKSYIKPWTWGR